MIIVLGKNRGEVMAYRYGGKISSKLKSRLAKGIVCSALALSIFSVMNPALAWITLYYYHLPSVDPGIMEDPSDEVIFNWKEVEGMVFDGMKRYEENERKQYGSDYEVDSGFNRDKSKWYWESYTWDYEGYRNIISSFTFDTIGGTLVTTHRYGEGDWVTSRPPGWRFGDDFAMYSSLFNHTIPIRDMVARARLNSIRKMNGTENDTGEDNTIIGKLKEIKGKTEERTEVNARHGLGKYAALVSFATNGGLKNLISDLRNPETLMKGVVNLLDNQKTVVSRKSVITDGHPDSDGFEMYYGHAKGYAASDMEADANGKIAKDKLAYLDKVNEESAEAYVKASEELEKMQEKLQKLMESQSDSGEESPTAAKQRDENIRRMQIAIKNQQEELDKMEERRQMTQQKVALDINTIQRQYERDQMHMPTAKEFAKEMKEKREKYSTSRDLGYRKFGTSGKADFSKILDNAVNPKLEDQIKEKE